VFFPKGFVLINKRKEKIGINRVHYMGGHGCMFVVVLVCVGDVTFKRVCLHLAELAEQQQLRRGNGHPSTRIETQQASILTDDVIHRSLITTTYMQSA